MSRQGWTRRRFVKLVGAGALGAALAGTGFGWSAAFAQSPPTIKLGLMDDFTGQGQRGAQLSLKASQLAIDKLNKGGARYHYELIQGDTETSESGAVDAANRLINRGDISFVIGPQRTNELLPIQPMFGAAAIPQIMIGSTDKALTDQHAQAPLSLRYSLQDISQMAPVAKYALQVNGHQTFFDLGVDNGDGRDALTAFDGIAEGLGGQIIEREFYPFGNTDFSTLVAKFLASKADGIVVSDGLPTSVIAVLQELKRQSVSLDRFYGSIVFGGPTFYSQMGSLGDSDGITFPWFYDDGVANRTFDGTPPPSEALAMDQAYVDATGSSPGPTAFVQAWAWGSVMLIDQAIERLATLEGADALMAMDPVTELPTAVVNRAILGGSTEKEAGATFSLTLGDAIGFLACGQADVLAGAATYQDGTLTLMRDRNWAADLVTGLC